MPVAVPLQAVVRRAGLEGRLRQERAIVLWKRVAGPELAARSRALEVRDGTLWVGVESPAWAAQMSFLRSELIRRLQAEGAPLAGIRFRLARLERGGAADAASAAPARLPAAEPWQVRLAERLAAPLDDLRLAAAWRSLIVAGLRRSWGRAEVAAHASALACSPDREEG